jgi:magnesium chelatase subunit I
VAQSLVGKAIRSHFLEFFPNPEQEKKQKQNSYKTIVDWFGDGETLDVMNDASNKDYRKTLNGVPGLSELVEKLHGKKRDEEKLLLMEFALHGLAEYSMLSKRQLVSGTQFKDLLSSMFNMPGEDEDFEE